MIMTAIRHARSKGLLYSVLALALAIPSLFFYTEALDHAHALSLLLQVSNSNSAGVFEKINHHPVDVTEFTISTPRGAVKARLYAPRDVKQSPGMVIVHGVHHLGMEEPRLKAFAQALAASGIAAMTPELPGIADYHISRESVDVIGASARSLSESLHGRQVGVMGISFSGGLALVAASDPRYQSAIGFVVAIGAHADMARVGRFYATDQLELPDGRTIHTPAHVYGPLVLVYARVERFFPPADVTVARETLRLLLYEREPEARRKARELSPPSQTRMELLFQYKKESIRDELLDGLQRDAKELAEISPHSHLKNIRVPVFLLHGSGDTVIPPSESEWLAREIRRPWVRAKLISPSLSHVEVNGALSVMDKFRLVHFLARMLEETRTANVPKNVPEMEH